MLHLCARAPYILLDDTLFEELGKVHLADSFSGIVGCYLGHVMLYHEFDKLLEGGGLRVPSSTGSPASEFLGFVRFLSLPGS